MDKLREWLTKNKIFFDTIMASFLATMAIIISINQTKLTNLQTKIALYNSLPQFIINAKQIYDNESKYVNEEVLTIKNSG